VENPTSGTDFDGAVFAWGIIFWDDGTETAINDRSCRYELGYALR